MTTKQSGLAAAVAAMLVVSGVLVPTLLATSNARDVFVSRTTGA